MPEIPLSQKWAITIFDQLCLVQSERDRGLFLHLDLNIITIYELKRALSRDLHHCLQKAQEKTGTNPLLNGERPSSSWGPTHFSYLVRFFCRFYIFTFTIIVYETYLSCIDRSFVLKKHILRVPWINLALARKLLNPHL